MASANKWMVPFLSEEHAGQTDHLRASGHIHHLTILSTVQGVEFALARSGRVLIADEMGLGKTVQALSIACAIDAWPLLVVAPATLR
jgi:SWI/SNF-related matrix-associated actin-dependent regulator 1 of chromatin subfamily A